MPARKTGRRLQHHCVPSNCRQYIIFGCLFVVFGHSKPKRTRFFFARRYIIGFFMSFSFLLLERSHPKHTPWMPSEQAVNLPCVCSLCSRVIVSVVVFLSFFAFCCEKFPSGLFPWFYGVAGVSECSRCCWLPCWAARRGGLSWPINEG